MYLLKPYGTIVCVTHSHRIRLTDSDLALIIASLKARKTMTSRLRRHQVERLIARLTECAPGNPMFLHGEFEQTHEDELDPEDCD